jgi:hypothetical protein
MKEQATKVELVEMMEVGTTCLGVPPNSDPKNLTGTLEESRQKKMSTLSWNCRGLGQPQTVQELVRLVRNLCPKIVFYFRN